MTDDQLDISELDLTLTWESPNTDVFQTCTEAIVASNTRVGGKLDDIQVRVLSVVGFQKN